MKKIILDLAITLDGFIEGPDGEIDWCIMDDDMNLDGFLSGIDTIFYGRVSYDLWEIFSRMQIQAKQKSPSGRLFILKRNMFFQAKGATTAGQHLSILSLHKR